MSSKVITTTGQLRAELARIIADVRTGKLEIHRAQIMVKAAGKITDSLYAEAKIEQMALTENRTTEPLGTLRIT